MKTFDFPSKKVFEQDFIFRGKILFTLKYKQATLQEFFDFNALSPEEQFLELYSILEKQIPVKWYQNIIKKMIPGYKTKFDKAIKIDELVENIQLNRFRLYDSIFTEFDKRKSKKTIKGGGLFSASLKAICNGYSSSIREVMEYLTLEQFLWLSDGLRYESNMGSKEGQKENDFATIDKEAVRKRAEQTRRAFENNK